jgi:DNA-binding FadR family transcriptional regulator
MRYEKVEREDLSDAVARQIRQAILSGDHQPGELLPPERELAAHFGVDRHTLRSALTELEQQALVQRRQGSGCRVLDYRETATLELLRHLVVNPGTDGLDPTIIRQAIEVADFTLQGLMDLVVDRADAVDVQDLRRALDALGAAIADADADAIGVERQFIHRIWRSAHSVVAELLANTFEQIFDAAIDPEGRARLLWGDQMVASGRLAAYEEVISAIERRDHARARALVSVILSGLPDVVVSAAQQPAAPTKRRPRRKQAG